jgi:hypothetical protein
MMKNDGVYLLADNWMDMGGNPANFICTALSSERVAVRFSSNFLRLECFYSDEISDRRLGGIHPQASSWRRANQGMSINVLIHALHVHDWLSCRDIVRMLA